MYPDFTNETNPVQSHPLDETVKPTKPSILLSIFIALFIGYIIVDLVLDYVNQKEVIDIVFDWLLLGLWIFVGACSIRTWVSYKRIKGFYDYIREQDNLAKANPAVRIAETFAYYRRTKYYLARDIACAEYQSMKKRSPKKYEKALNSLAEDTKTCEEIRRIIFKDPSILKEIAKQETVQNHIEDKLMLRYKELLEMTPEERAEVEKKYDHSAYTRNYARKNYKKK